MDELLLKSIKQMLENQEYIINQLSSGNTYYRRNLLRKTKGVLKEITNAIRT